MIPQTPFPQMLLPRLGNARQRLAERIWHVDPSPLKVRQSRPSATLTAVKNAKGLRFSPVKSTPHHWGGLFEQCWWQLDVPAGKRSADRYLRWVDQGEATLYVDGSAYAGIDPGHPFVPLPGKAGTYLIESICARTGIWVTGEPQGVDAERGSRFEGAYLAERNEDAWHAWYDLDVLMRVMETLERPGYPTDKPLWAPGGYRAELIAADPLFRKLLHRLNGAVDALERDGVSAMRKQLRAIYRDFPASPEAMDVVLTGHAHVDLVWLWPESSGRFKASHSFANALRALERYPEATFGYSQPASYAAVKQRDPKLTRRVKRQITAGRWDATGAMWVESDVQLPCGEALVRAFALGQKGFRELRGEDSRCVWIPDVFGYSGCLPTIMAGFGVPYFYTTKMHWSGATRFPHSSFRWVGHDGSEVLAHLSWTHYNQEVTPSEFKHAAQQHRQAAVHDEALFPCGYGDGGGGLTDGMCERARRLADLAGMPRAKWGNIEPFFDRMAERADDLPSWRGEMYLEYHRGVQTTHGRLKAAYRAAERGLQAWEAVRCATGGGPLPDEPWERVCFAQFHDALPGSSIRRVYDEMVPELERIAADALRHAGTELGKHGRGKKQPCVFNPLPMPRVEVIDGKVVSLPPLCGTVLPDADSVDAPPVAAEANRLSNGTVDARFNPAGELRSLRIGGHPVRLTQPGAQLWAFPDLPAAYDAWDIDHYTLSNGRRIKGAAAPEVELDATQTHGRVSFRRSLGEAGEAVVRYTLDAASPVLRIEIDLDLAAPQTLVKLVFPTGYTGREARYGAPLGSTLRPQWPGPLDNEAMFENPASRWAAVADDDERDGLALISESKFGFGAREGLLHVSLARSARITGENGGGGTTTIKPGEADDFADLGRHHIRLAVGRHAADLPADRQPAALADTLFTPIIRYTGRPAHAGLRGIDVPVSVVASWAVPEAKNAWTLRLHEALGGRGTVRLRLADGLTAERVDLRGEPTGKAGSEVMPYAVASFRVTR